MQVLGSVGYHVMVCSCYYYQHLLFWHCYCFGGVLLVFAIL